jgi:hypothetical protein
MALFRRLSGTGLMFQGSAEPQPSVRGLEQLWQLGKNGGNAPGLVVKLSVHLLIPVPISPPVMDGI